MSPRCSTALNGNAGAPRNVTRVVKLSVIVPFYNVQAYAPDALSSLRANARQDVEFVLVDDCSTDDTPHIVAEAAQKLPGAVYIQRERNGGLATARNTGLDVARGEYLTFLDGDDWLAPGYLARLLAAAAELGCDFLRTDHVRCTGSSRGVARVPHGLRNTVLNPRDVILPVDRGTCVDYPYAWAGVYHRRLLDAGLLRFTDGLRTAEDRPWIWRLHREAASFAVVGLLGVFYRRGLATSLTQVGDARQLDFLRAFDQVIDETSRDREAERLLPKAVRTYCAILAHHLDHEDRFAPRLRRELRARGAAALRRLPAAELAEALSGMDHARATRLRRLRRRPGGVLAAAT